MTTDYIDFQSRSTPVAYLITFRCFGTWLHGDERGAVDRKFHHQYGQPKMQANSRLKAKELSAMKQSPFKLGAEERDIVYKAINDVCAHRSCSLYAVNVRTNHVHIIVAAIGKPEALMNTFKAYATRNLKAAHLIDDTTKIWARHGSIRYLWDAHQIEMAIDYVVNGQGDDLPNF